MKNLIYTLLFLASLSIGCKKNEAILPVPDTEKQDVIFSISKFSQTVESLSKTGASVSAAGDTLSNHAKYLYCYMTPFSGFGPNVMTVQTADSAGFGTLKLKLTQGKYNVAFFASTKPLSFFTSFRFDQLQLLSSGQTHWEDLFILPNYVLEVGDSTVNAQVRLPRWTGAVQVNVEDAIPANASKITFEVTNDASDYSFYANHASIRTARKEFILTESQKGQTNQKFLLHLLRLPDYDRNLQTLTIRAYDQQNALIVEKKLPQFRNDKNVLTQFTGRLFSTAPASTSFTVSVNANWDQSGPTATF